MQAVSSYLWPLRSLGFTIRSWWRLSPTLPTHAVHLSGLSGRHTAAWPACADCVSVLHHALRIACWPLRLLVWTQTESRSRDTSRLPAMFKMAFVRPATIRFHLRDNHVMFETATALPSQVGHVSKCRSNPCVCCWGVCQRTAVYNWQFTPLDSPVVKQHAHQTPDRPKSYGSRLLSVCPCQ